MTKQKILILSEEDEVAENWAHALRQRGLIVDTAPLDTQAPQRFAEGHYALGIVDINRDTDEVSYLCRSIRAVFDNPLLVFSYNSDERSHLQLYADGIDESVTKPIGVLLMLAKVSAWVERSSQAVQRSSPFHTEGFHLNASGQALVTPEQQSIRLSKLEYRLMLVLLANRGRAVPAEVLTSRVWGQDDAGSRSSLKRLIYRLRQKIEPDPTRPRYVQTVSGDGYKFPIGTDQASN